jgi:hypothetical protein
MADVNDRPIDARIQAGLPTGRPHTPMLDNVNIPADLRNFSIEQLEQLAGELRAETVDAVSSTGGHLGASLGVVELTVALHATFETPVDKLIWDVGHQAYPHKILTGRRDRIRSLRQAGGLSGFTRRSESEYDPFGAAHSSTSISAGLGFAVANELQGHKDHEQRWRPPLPADRGAERQRNVHRPAGGRHERLSVPPDQLAEFSLPARNRRENFEEIPLGPGAHRQARRGIRPRHPDRRHAVRGARLLLRRPDRRP